MDPRGRLPNFMIIGAMKAGTTTLYNQLRSHPRIFLTAYKEPEFFVAEKNWSRGVGWYSRLFCDAGDAVAVGEASTSYTKPTEYPGVPQRIASVVPDVRLVYVLRHPVERIRSMYEHMVLTGRERRPIDTAVLEDDLYVAPSRYADNIRRYLEYFPADHIHVLRMEDLVDDVVTTMHDVTRFLGVPPDDGFTPVPRSDLTTRDRRPDRRLKTMLRDTPAAYRALELMPPGLRQRIRNLATRPEPVAPNALSVDTVARLSDRLADDVTDLRRLLGPRFDGWGLIPVS